MGLSIIGGVNTSSLRTINSNNSLKSVEKSGSTFADILASTVENTNSMIIESENQANLFAAGLTDNMDQVLIASEKADIALQFTWAVRNKIMDAYNEIMRMQI